MSLTATSWRRVCAAKDAEIVRLRAENERLQAALEAVADAGSYLDAMGFANHALDMDEWDEEG